MSKYIILDRMGLIYVCCEICSFRYTQQGKTNDISGHLKVIFESDYSEFKIQFTTTAQILIIEKLSSNQLVVMPKYDKENYTLYHYMI